MMKTQKDHPLKAKSRSGTTAKRQKATATTRSTAGPGFHFEDVVGAWLLQKTFSGEPLPDMHGLSASRLQTQTSALGWNLDDLLITCGAAPDDRKIAISCKSNVQVSAAGLPQDFVRAAWQQWTQADGPMRRNRDRMMLVTRGTHANFQATWTEIKQACSGMDVPLAMARMRATEKQRRILGSVTAPRDSALGAITDDELIHFIQHLMVIPTDFDLTPSAMESAAIGACRKLLVNGSADEGKELWVTLVNAARSARLGNGTLEIVALWAELRTRFALNDHPDFVAAWKALHALTADYVTGFSLSLPTGLVLPRGQARSDLIRELTAHQIVVLHGDSGTGKSALAKATLDDVFPNATRVWLGPDTAELVLSEVRRHDLNLSQPLLAILQATSKQSNFLVLDAAERFSAGVAGRVRSIITTLTGDKSSAWRVLVIAQTQSVTDGLSGLLRDVIAQPFEVKPLAPGEVKAALLTSSQLRWLVSEADTINALTNLRALAWVMEAEAQFPAENRAVFLSHAAIVDRLWQFWTDRRLPLQSLLMRLGVREADFEHSVALTDLDPADASALQSPPPQLPVRLNSRNRVEFQHDLAAEWARFQRLKEIAFSVHKWAVYATNPLWTGALRMLGQFLLRERVAGRNAWDAVYEALEASPNEPTHATDVLLDALCLDPLAATFLSERADFLFADHGARLNRLLRRFHHVATVAALRPDSTTANSSMRLYIEASQRIPVVGKWRGVVNFLISNHERVADLTSPAVADICALWATRTPLTSSDGSPFPYRRELAQLSIATARTLQVEQETHRVIRLDDSENSILAAAFALAEDDPAEVSAWALEMAQRRPWSPGVVTKVQDIRRKQAEEHKHRMKTDAEYRSRHDRRRSLPTFLPSGRRLPPWPLGPKKRVDRHFRDLCMQPSTLQPLMRVRPAEAAEILLATIVEGEPEERYDRHSPLHEEYGLEHETVSHPTIWWQSPFFPFLQINPEIALGALIALVEFCTDRWAHQVTGHSRTKEIPAITVTLETSTTKQFVGTFDMLNWSHTSSHFIGQLTCALAALEQWLCMRYENGVDIGAYIDRILRSSRSVAFLGVFLDVGKHHPELFRTHLLPVLTTPEVYFWDDNRLQWLGVGFDQFTWLRKGELVFDMARQWWFAPHRTAHLLGIVQKLAARYEDFGQVLAKTSSAWQMPSSPKATLELRALQTELDPANYRLTRDEQTGDAVVMVEYPAELRQEIAEYQQSTTPGLQALNLPAWCKNALAADTALSPEQAAALAAILERPESLGDDDDLEEYRQLARIAAACTLLTKGSSWLEQHQTSKSIAEDILWSVLASVEEDSSKTIQHRMMRRDERLLFAAFPIFQDLLQSAASPEISAPVIRLVTSGDAAALSTFMSMAAAHKRLLGPKWLNLLRLCVMWAGLQVLAPQYGSSAENQRRWGRWLRWLRTRSLREDNSNKNQLDFLDIARRIVRLEHIRWKREYARKDVHWRRNPDNCYSPGLHTHVLCAAFGWLFVEDAKVIESFDAQEVTERCGLLKQLLAFEIWHHPKKSNDRDREPLPSELGYQTLSAIAWMVPNIEVGLATELWQNVLRLDDEHHHFIDRFISIFFMAGRHSKPAAVVLMWQSMLKFSLAHETWTEGRYWYRGQRLLRQLLGFSSEPFLDTNPKFQVAVSEMRGLYERWANKFLPKDEENLAGFCHFLTSATGKGLRLSGLVWIHHVIEAKPQWRSWRRDGTGDTVIAFVDLVLNEEAERFSQEPAARDAILAITARLVAQQIPAALPLQEHARAVLRTKS